MSVEASADASAGASAPGLLVPAQLELVEPGVEAPLETQAVKRSRHRGWVVRRALALADVVGILAAFVLTQLAFSGNDVPGDRVSTEAEIALFAITLPAWIVLGRLYGLYSNDEQRADHSTVDDVFGVFNMLTVGAWLLFGLAYLLQFANPSLPKLGLFWLLAILLVVASRTVARAFVRRTDAYVQNTLILGADYVGQRVACKLKQHPEYGVNVVGFVDDDPLEREMNLGDLTVVGRAEELPALVEALNIERVIVAFAVPHEQTLALIRSLEGMPVQVDVVPRLFEVLGPEVRVHTAEGLALLGLPSSRLSSSALLLKRSLDVTLAGLGLIVFSPLLALAAVAIKLDSPGPVLFKQKRVGQGRRTFRVWKFRTMCLDAEARKGELAHLNKHAGGDDRMFKIPDDPRATRVGRILRRTSFDELPQLVNVLSGQMSIVGPRPIVLDEHRHVEGWGERRLDLKPGITGLWQVLGRDDIPFAEMVELDYRYVTTWSLANDLKLIAKTLPVLARQRLV